MVKLVALAGAVLCALAAAAGASLVLFNLAVPGGSRGSPVAGADIPAELEPVYRAAAASCPLPWEVLAAVGKVESDHGRSQRPGVRSGANAAGAMGPMQFLGATWAAYGVDGDGDSTADPYGAVDSIWGAARYLCANGAGDPARLRSAVWNYNHDDAYVDHVLAVAAGYRDDPPAGVDARALADHPNLVLTPWARADLLAGRIDQRVVDFLAWAASRHTISVSVLATGHSKFVRDS
ncbi:MAG: lytic transglycosylase domain-containing protein, partial [Acidimicrobiia bacterium]